MREKQIGFFNRGNQITTTTSATTTRRSDATSRAIRLDCAVGQIRTRMWPAIRLDQMIRMVFSWCGVRHGR